MLPWVWRCVVLALVLAELTADESSPLLECPSPPAKCTYTEDGGPGEYFFVVSGYNVHFDYLDGDFFVMTCDESLALEDPGLPRFKEAVRVGRVTFKKCAPPINKSYAAVLAALNVTTFSELLLTNLPTAVVTREHLADLNQLTRLDINGEESADVSLAPGALSALDAAPALQYLSLHSVRTPAADLTHLPPSLRTLKQWSVDVDRVYFDSLPNLINLDLNEKKSVAVNASKATALKILSVTSLNNVVPEDALPPMLTDLVLFEWNDTRPAPKTRCAHLHNLKVSGTNNPRWPVSLPDEWVANCALLTDLLIYFVPVNGTLPARLLAHARALERLSIQNCDLHELPPGFLDDTPHLTSLDLSYNSLTELPSGLFLHTQSLEELYLSNNLLTSSVAGSLSTLTSLRILKLNDNSNLGDLCPGSIGSFLTPANASPLKSLTSLRLLNLSNTRVTHVCRDWRQQLVNLTTLNLKDTAITYLNLAELQFRRSKSGAKVFLSGKEFDLQYSRFDYLDAVNDPGGTKAKVIVEGSLILDCSAYWTVMEFKRSSNNTSSIVLPEFENLKLDKIDVDTLTCNASKHCSPLALPRNCSCGVRDDLEHGSVVIAECAGAGLTSLPRLPAAEHKWRLHLAYNNITNITADRVSHIADVVELDLRNNSIKRMDGEVAAKLASVPLWLSGNQLECGCESYGMLMAMVGTDSHLRDKVNVTCMNGSPLATTPLEPCNTLTGAVAGALVVLLAVAFVASVVLSRPATLQRVKTFLMWLGWMPWPPEPADDDRRFDVFVSYAHEDEELVVEKLAARLESGARPYKLCLHYRDWAPGEWIPAQIAASVRASRRTLAVVSRHYLESGWARAEFREATAASLRDGTPRLVVVLLEDPAGLTLDPELAAYVRNNTYVRWDDPWFWEKLKQALPPPRPRHRKEARASSAPRPDIALRHKCVSPESVPAAASVPACDTPCSA